MSNIQDGQKTLEVKIRPYPNQSQERPDQNGASRVLLSMNTLLDLGLSSGQSCYVWKVGDEKENKREATAWLSTEKNLSKKIVQMSKAFQDACGFKLGDDLNICAGNSEQRAAESILFRDVTAQEEGLPEIDEVDRHIWEWHLGKHLDRAKVVFTGMVFKITVDGPKRAFTIDLINNTPNGLGQYLGGPVRISSLAQNNNVEPEINSSNPVSLQVSNIAGIDQALEKLNAFLSEFNMDFAFPWAHQSGAVLLHGGHGSGKTFILNKIANSGWGKVYRIKKKDAKPAAIEKVFKDAKLSQPSIIILDDLQDLVSKDDSISQSILETLEDELDSIYGQESTSLPRVLVAAATLESNSIPISLKGISRFSTEIPLSIPDASARKAILKSLAPPIIPESRDEVLEKLGDRTHAYTAKDLVMLLSTAGKLAEKEVDRSVEGWKAKEHYLSQDNIEQALLLVRPTAMHDITLKPPSVRWDEIGGQEGVKKALRRAIETPLLHPERMKRIGITPTKGLLLYGPPGCSKTLSAQAMATEAGFNFFAVKGAELLNMYVGESERAVRNIFARARAASPSIIFFDEIDSIGSKREGGGRNNGVNVLTTLLNEMDGIETLKGVTVLAATNKPQNLDLALLRPGRFDELLYVAPPDLAGREAILRVRKRKMDFADDVDIVKLARETEGYSGAELVAICEKAGKEAAEICEQTGEEIQVHMEHFERAMTQVNKQITPELVASFRLWAAGMGGDTD